MVRKQYLAGLDIGGFSIRAVIAEDSGNRDERPTVIGVGEVPSFGLRKGMVVDIEELSKSVNAAMVKAETMAGVSVSKVAVNVNGQNIHTQLSKGVVAVGRADEEIAASDVERVIAAAGDVSVPPNNEVMHILPRSYRIDDQTGIKNPIGMKGVRLEVEALVVEGFTPQMKNLATCLQFSNLDVDHIVFSPIAAAESILDRRKRDIGVMLLDIGAFGAGLAVFEDGDLLHTTVIPVGASHVTNDIAIGIRTSIDTAEQIKIAYGTCLPDEIDQKEELDLSMVASSETGSIFLRHVAEIIEARTEELLDAVNEELRHIEREGMLPGGVMLVGGGSKLPGIVEVAKRILRLPVAIGYPKEIGGLLDKVDDPAFAVATGLIQWQRNQLQSSSQGESFLGRFAGGSSLKGGVGTAANKMKGWMERFLP